ncbi:hypothetical protein SprV_0401565900 [Sparganum proliferum]
MIQAVEMNASKDLLSGVQQGNASVVVADLAVAFPLVEVHDCGVFEILQDLLDATSPGRAPSGDPRGGGTVSVDVSRCRVRSGCFAAGDLSHGPDGFVDIWREVEVSVGLHLRPTGDGGVGYGGETVEDASEVLGP